MASLLVLMDVWGGARKSSDGRPRFVVAAPTQFGQ